MTFGDDPDNQREIQRMIEDAVASYISQHNIPPDMVKQRHVGEGVRFVRSGVAADRPTSGEKTGAMWFSSDTDTLNIWNGTAWVQEVLT